MKIDTIDPNKLSLTISQRMLHVLGLVIIIGSLFVVLYLMKEYTIVCKEKQAHRAGQCTLETDILNFHHTSTNLGNLEFASVLDRPSKKSKVYFVVLKTSEGLINLTGGSSAGRSDKDIAAAGINSYINTSSETTYKIPYPTPVWIYALVAILPLLGLVLLAVKNAMIVFNGPLRTVVITQKGLFGSSESSLLFADIDQIIMKENRGSKGAKTYGLAFALNDKKELPFPGNAFDSKDKVENIVKQLNDFIDKNRPKMD